MRCTRHEGGSDAALGGVSSETCNVWWWWLSIQSERYDVDPRNVATRLLQLLLNKGNVLAIPSFTENRLNRVFISFLLVQLQDNQEIASIEAILHR